MLHLECWNLGSKSKMAVFGSLTISDIYYINMCYGVINGLPLAKQLV